MRVATNAALMERCGHWLATECPDRLTQQLLTFFGVGQTRQSPHELRLNLKSLRGPNHEDETSRH